MTALGIAIVLHPFQNTPFIDDWVYSWPVQHLLDTGTFLFPEGADLDAVNSGLQHAAPLHNAVSSGSLAAVKTLVEAGARLDTKDIGYRLAPLDWAEWYVREAARGRDAREYAEIAAYLRDRRERS